ncbi:LOW QUALITY PROTEIN: protein argonaute 8 [Capsella rubella]|uniref:LOW QUALITY PROTEIN: protein argonaute 8 n=1 Tax=Capsella rubella TaxID=81985 RepID=UPI000CD4EA42|nr:LOW QUALITY PROTEIN: protein argonaute 8 [Capsella rubella]
MDTSLRLPQPLERGSAKSKSSLLPLSRRGHGSNGRKINLLTNHFSVDFSIRELNSQYFFHYSVAITYENGSPVMTKGVGRRILEKVQQTYQTDLDFKHFAYDGDKSLFTVGPLPRSKLDFSVVLEDVPSRRNAEKRLKLPHQSEKYNVAISFAAKIPMQAISHTLQGRERNRIQDMIRAMDVILGQNAARQGCLLFRQSFFYNDAKYFANVGEGVVCCKGFHSSFQNTQGGLSLKIDVSTTMIIKPGAVVDFLIENQGVKDPFSIDWKKAKSALKNLRVKVIHSNREYKITGLSELRCKDQPFTLKKKNANGEAEEVETTVFDYFTKMRDIKLHYSGDLPCINVGKPNRPPVYFPIELCELVSLQRYTKALTSFQRSNLVKEARQKPQQNMDVLTKACKNSNYNDDPMLQDCAVRIGSGLTQLHGRVLPTPKLKAGNGADIFPSNGSWNFIDKKFFEPATVTRWAVVNFSARCDPHKIIRELIRCGKMKGINVDPPYRVVFEENARFKGEPGSVRVDKMFEYLQSTLGQSPPKFLLCILEKKNSDVYEKSCSVWNRESCIVPPQNVKEQYLINVLLKINAKLGGLNSILDMEQTRAMPLVMRVPTIIIGMSISHGSPGQSDAPSIAAVVSSREWPFISKYKACVRTQTRKAEIIENLFKPVSDKDDEGIMRELLLDFESSSGVKPNHIIIFRDGVSESQFNRVLNIELDQMMQKNHHTKFFQTRSPDNVPPGTIVDSNICHPRNNDFYLCAHAGKFGTTRPTHYHVLYDEIGFNTDNLQELVHSLSYVYQRSTSAISLAAPICYAHLAASQMATAMKFEDMSETSPSHDGITTAGVVSVPPMPKLNTKVSGSMFFC